LLFLVVADYFTFPSTHGRQVASLKPNWSHDEVEWDRRSKRMEKLGLLDRNTSNEVMRTALGTAIVFLALQAPEFVEVTATMKSNQAMVRKWGILDA
jgi:predicted glycosyltransferase